MEIAIVVIALALTWLWLDSLRARDAAKAAARSACEAEGLLLLGWMQSRIKRLEVEIGAEGGAEVEEVSSTPIPRAIVSASESAS